MAVIDKFVCIVYDNIYADYSICCLHYIYIYFISYGDVFLSETYFYHITRADTKHNFSPYFYMLHLSQHSTLLSLIGIIAFLPQLVLIIFTGYTFYRHIELAVFLQTAVFATYNKVVTSQVGYLLLRFTHPLICTY